MNIHWLVGNLTDDANYSMTSTSKKVSNMRVATNEGFGENRRTDYHTVVAWEDLAELAAKYGKKGARVAVEGASRTRSYETKDGTKRYVTETHAKTLRFLTQEDDDLPTAF